MNRIYRSIWNEMTRSVVAVAEKVRAHAKSTRNTRTVSTVRAAQPAVPPPIGNMSAGPPKSTRIRPLALEQRFMFDGAAVAATLDTAHDAQAQQTTDFDAATVTAMQLAEQAPPLLEQYDARVLSAGTPMASGAPHEIVFIEDNVADYQNLAAGAKAGTEVVLLDSRGDGLHQMLAYLDGRTGIDAIHIISHGAQAQLKLGTLTLDATGLSARSSDLAALGATLTDEGDLMLYGCDVASGAGQDFIAAIAQATGADVAASIDPTGATHLGGDWQLETHSGPIDTANPLTAPALDAYANLLATATLTAGNDSPVLSAGDDTVTVDTANTLNSGDTIDGLAGSDTLEISAAQTVVLGATTLTNFETVNITAGIQNITTHDATVGSGQTLTIDASSSSSAVTWDGTAETDGTFHFTGGSGKDSVKGGAGNDTIYGGSGNDTIGSSSSGVGNDLIYGDQGNDTLYGGSGIDSLYGGDGNDFIYAQAGDDLIYGENGNDGLSGAAGNDTIYGGDGNDTLIGGNDNDLLYGGDGNDWIWGQNGNDLIYGGAGNDTLSGDAGNDTIYGEAGNDTISGAAGLDVLYGGDGNDVFRGSASDLDGDTVADFTAGDSIIVNSTDLSALNGAAASSTIDLGGGKSLTVSGISGASGTWSAVFSGGSTTIMLTPNNAPTITSDGGGAIANLSVAENQTAVTTVTATDVDSDALSYSITGGTDAAKFSIDASTGTLSFTAAPDFEAPTDNDGNNTYLVDVTVNDSHGATDTQAITVTVTDVGEGSTTPTVQPPAEPPPPPPPPPPPTPAAPDPTPVSTEPPSFIRNTGDTATSTVLGVSPLSSNPIDPAHVATQTVVPAFVPSPSPAPSGPSSPATPDASATPPAAPSFISIGADQGASGSNGLSARPDLGTAAIEFGRNISIELPTGTFTHSDSNAIVSVSALQSDGRPLPSWLKFDPRTGTLSGKPPPGMEGKIDVKIIARDAKGQEASTHLQIDIGQHAPDSGGKQSIPIPGPQGSADIPARIGLSEQLHHAAAQRSLPPHLAALSRSIQAARERT